jgi:hypothetical protein
LATGNNESELGTDVRLVRSSIGPDYFSPHQTPKLADPVIGLTNVKITVVLIINDAALKGIKNNEQFSVAQSETKRTGGLARLDLEGAVSV